MQQETKVIRGLRLFFAVCFCVVLLCVITVNYPLAGVILFLTGLLVIVSHVNVSRGGGVRACQQVPSDSLSDFFGGTPGGGGLTYYPHRI